MFGVKSKNIPLIFASSILGGMMFFLPILALYLEKSLFSVTNIAIIFAVESIVIVLFEIPTGAIADLFGRKRTFIAAYFSVLIGLVFLYIGGSMLMFIMWAILNAVAMALASGTDSALIYDTLKEENKEHLFKKVIGTYRSLWPIGASISAIIGGHLASISLQLPILYTFIPMFISLGFVLFIKEPNYKKESHKNILKHMRITLNVISTNKQLLLLTLGLFIIFAFSEVTHLLAPLYYQFKGLPIEFFGYAAAAISASAALGFYFSHSVSEKIGNKTLILLTVLFSPLLMLISTYLSGFVAVFIFIIPAFFFGLRSPTIEHLIQLESNSSQRATIMSTINFAGRIGLVIFAPFIGYLSDLYTINTAFRISAIIMLSLILIFWFLKEKN